MTKNTGGQWAHFGEGAHQEHQAFVRWKEKVVQKLSDAKAGSRDGEVANRLCMALSGAPEVGLEYRRVMDQLVRLVDLGVKRSLGVKVHLIGSIARAYPEEHDLLYRTLKDRSCLFPFSEASEPDEDLNSSIVREGNGEVP